MGSQVPTAYNSKPASEKAVNKPKQYWWSKLTIQELNGRTIHAKKVKNFIEYVDSLNDPKFNVEIFNSDDGDNKLMKIVVQEKSPIPVENTTVEEVEEDDWGF